MKFKKLLFILLILIFVGIFAFSGYQVVTYLLDAKSQSDLYNGLASIVEEAQSHNPTPTNPDQKEPADTQEETSDADEAEEPTEPPILPEYQELYEMNSDLIGWLKIEDTDINYPVMQTPDEKDFYLRRNFNKEYSTGGCLYAREQCNVFLPSDNITIYGHHMRNGSMFADLDGYNRESFWETHSEITFNTLYEHHTYQVFAVFKTSASVDKGFKYHQFVDADSQEDFDDFITTCKELSFYDTGITPEYGDKLICLSTCEYTLENGRMVVAAVRID